jgi:hypothetical protein
MTFEESILGRIEELLGIKVKTADHIQAGEIQMAALNIFAALYGSNSPQVKSIESTRKEIRESDWSEPDKIRALVATVQGLLRTVATDIREGRVRDLQAEARGEILADFLVAARAAMENGHKEVAAVLACGALEDTLKKMALAKGLDVYDSDMSQVVNALKRTSLVKGPQGSLIKVFVNLRNKAFHAQWEEIDKADVKAAISFTEGLLLQHFGGTNE